ncbi:MAG TPA: helix-turn-helix domain-containing protein [Solirubrobacteraceae bacterium]|nr:helix-turn-helix domain-containing protein [Solirubrobacteraceae bacterium]
MDRDSLESLLGQGLSLAEIGRRFDRHEATVSYWMKKYGLEAVRREQHAARGSIDRQQLEQLVDTGASITEIATAVDRSKATVRHWLREYGLKTRRAEQRHSPDSGEPLLQRHCPTHGLTLFRRRSGGGYRCLKCRTDAVSRRRRKVKRVLVEEAGGCCAICKYERSLAALEFHHLVPAEKSFSLSHRGVTRSMERARQEASKCVLLCANCHAEVEAGVTTVPTGN